MATKKNPPAESLEKGGAKKGMQPVYAKGEMQKAKKAMDEEDGEVADSDSDEDEKENPFDKAKKSMGDDLSEDDLQKSLDKLGAIATAGSPVSRKDELLKKSLGDGELSKAEKAELFKLMGGEEETPAPTLAKSVEETFTENEVLQKSVDVSDYLDENQKALIKSLTFLSDRIESGETRQHEFNLVLAKAVSGVGKLVKGMSERLGVMESQPARAPKSRGVAPGQVLHKGFGGQPAAEDQLNHNQILEGLDGLMQKSMTDGKGGFTEAGENILTATARFEQSRQITPSLLGEIQKFRATGTQH